MSMSLVSSVHFILDSISISLFTENVINLLVFLRIYSRPLFKGDLMGKTVIITGGNRGIGKSLVEQMSARGAKVIVACRDLTAGRRVAHNIQRKNPTAPIRVLKLDLASFKSVESFAATVLETEEKVDILVNNAGLTAGSYMETEDCLEMVTQVNFYSPIMLTMKLLPILKQSNGVVINVSSLAHFAVKKVDFDRLLNPSKYQYDSLDSYAQSKLLLILTTKYLKDRLMNENVKLITVDPGVTQTDLFKEVFYTFFKNMSFWVTRPFSRTNDQSADSIIQSLFRHKELYSKQSNCCMKDSYYVQPSKLAQDSKLGEKLWSVICPIIGVAKNGPSFDATAA